MRETMTGMETDPTFWFNPTTGTGNNPALCQPGRCRLVGVQLDEHRPDCPLHGFEVDPDFGASFDDSDGDS